MPSDINEISVRDLAKKYEANEAFVLLDVREPYEIALAALPGATLVPMMEIPQRFEELPRDRQIVVLCHHGARSERVTSFLLANGFSNVANLEGGIDAWSTVVDQSISRY